MPLCMSELVDEVLLEILDWLHPVDIQQVALVSRRFAHLTCSQRLQVIRLNRNLPEILYTFHNSTLSLYVREMIFDFPRLFDLRGFQENFIKLAPGFRNVTKVSWTTRHGLSEQGLLQSLVYANPGRITSFSLLLTYWDPELPSIIGKLFGQLQHLTLIEPNMDLMPPVPQRFNETLSDLLNGYTNLQTLILNRVTNYISINVKLPQLKYVAVGEIEDSTSNLYGLLSSPLLARVNLSTCESLRPFAEWLMRSPEYPNLKNFRLGVRNGLPPGGLEFFTLLADFLQTHSNLTELGIIVPATAWPPALSLAIKQLEYLDHFAAYFPGGSERSSELINLLPRTLNAIEVYGPLPMLFEIPYEQASLHAAALGTKFPQLRYLCPFNPRQQEEVELFAKQCPNLEWLDYNSVYRILRENGGPIQIQDFGKGARHPFAPMEPRRSRLVSRFE